MAAGLRTIVIRFLGDAKGLGEESKKALTGMQKFEKGVSVASAAVVGAGVAVAGGLAKIGDTWDSAFDNLHVATGAVGEDMKDLEESLKNVVGRTPNDIELMSDAMGQLATLTGATAGPLEDMTVAVTEASRLLGEDASANAAAFGEALRLWQVPAGQADTVMDKLFKATQDWNIGLGDLMGSLTAYGSTLMNVGFSMDETIALFGQLDAAGLDVSRTMPALNKAFGNWAKEGKDVQAEFAKVVDKIKNTESETKALGIATEIFGSRGASTMVAAIRSGAVAFDDLAGMLDGAKGLIGDTAEETDDWAEKWAKLKNEGMVAIQPAASAVFDQLGRGVDILRGLVEWGQRNTTTVKVLAIALGGIAAIILATNVALKAYAVIQGVVRAATIAWTVVQWALNSAFLANPLTWIVLGIIALVAAVVLAYQRFETFRNIVDTVFRAIVAVAKWWWENIAKRYIAGVVAAFKFVVEWGKKVWEAIKLYFTFWKNLFTTVVGWVISAKDRIVAGFQTVVDFVRSIPGKIKAALSKVGQFISAPFRAGFGAAKDAWNNTVGGKGFTIPGWVPGLGGKEFRFPRFHSGGVVPGPIGREVPILALGGERIMTREADLAAGGGEFTGTLVLDSGQLLGLVRGEIRQANRATKRRVLAGAGMFG